jgi:F-type H+-transporting ATPase subunit gamma
MSDTLANLRRKIDRARDLGSVVSTMKALAAANLSQYEESVRSLDDYYRTVQLGLSVSFRAGLPAAARSSEGTGARTVPVPVQAVHTVPTLHAVPTVRAAQINQVHQMARTA